MITAIVPIKKDSQRVERKNFTEINSKPLFFWILTSLQNSRFINEIIVNHDDEFTVNQVSKYFDSIKFIQRPESLFGHDVSMNKIIESSLEECKNNSIIQVHTTSPFLKTSTLDKAIEQHNILKQDIFSVTKLQERLYDADLNPINHDLENLIQTQDLEPIFLENSGFYIFSKDSFVSYKNRINEFSQIFEIDFPENLDIDNQDDLELAKAIFSLTS